MKRARRYRWRELIVLLAALACAGTWAASQVRSMRDKSEVAKMTEKMNTVCVGRFLIDVPPQASISFSNERIDGFDIESFEETESGFRERVAGLEATINAKSDSGGASKASGMVDARDLDVPGLLGRVLVYGRTRSYSMHGDRRIDDEWVSIDAHAHLDGLSFSLSMRYANESAARDVEAILGRLRVRAENEIPTEAGFCVWRAIFIEPLPPHKTEHIVMHIGFPEHPDVALAFNSMPGGGETPDLIARVANTDAESSPDELLRVTKLRMGKRSINGLSGGEILERMRELNFATTYAFMWETHGVDADPTQPFLSLELQGGISARPGGKPTDTTLHEDAVVALWDTISSSIRRRQSGPAPGSAPDATPSAPTLGAIAHAGEICTQSGWWRCSEGGPGVGVQGGAVQYVRKGERMPQARLLPHQTVWQKLRGIQPSIEPALPTSWQLVDKRHRPRTPAVVTLASAVASEGPWQEPVDAGRNVSLGARVRTGDPCPASGWWRCEESNALDGSRWFPRGSVLPAATFLVPGGLFGRAAGPDVIQRRSAWQLMRHAVAQSVSTTVSAASSLTENIRALPDAPDTRA